VTRVVSVVVPVYFNGPSLPALHERLLAVEADLASAGIGLELVFVDDGSGDNSLEILTSLQRLRDATIVVKLTRNFGSMAAIKAGFAHAKGDAIAILAADLQDPPELIPEMVKRWQTGAKFVICTRRQRDDPPVSKAFSAVYYRLLRRLAVPDFPKGGYDLSLVDRQLAPHVLQCGKTSYLLVFLYWLGFRPEVVHYDRAKREHGRSKWTFAKKFTASLDVLLGFSVVPIRAISAVGLAVSGISFAYGSFQLGRALFGRTDVPGFVSIVSLITFLLGLVILMLGIIGEYLWRILTEVNERPGFVVDQVLRSGEHVPRAVGATNLEIHSAVADGGGR
jgi:dolichol-phosphate mannosyltransferase